MIENLAEFAQTVRGRRAIGISVALAIEAVLLLMLLAMGIRDRPEPVPMAEVSTFDVIEAPPDSPAGSFVAMMGPDGQPIVYNPTTGAQKGAPDGASVATAGSVGWAPTGTPIPTTGSSRCA